VQIHEYNVKTTEEMASSLEASSSSRTFLV
jgi:hypothetical protein